MAAKTETPSPAAVEERGQFGSRLGFILAAIGSAVGFGSIARFPMNAANQGGAAFVLIYLLIMVFIGIPTLIAEFSMGRTAQKNPVSAFPVLTGNPRTWWRSAGMFYVLAAAFILSYYAILTGWTLRYLVGSFTGDYFDQPDQYFVETAEGPQAMIWFAVTMVLVSAALVGKVSKGIEKVNLIMMPTLFAIILGLVIYAGFLDNTGAGYDYYLKADFTKVTLPVVAAAIGQAFFSLSIGQGAMMTYASYLSRTTSLASNAAMISFSTLTFATMCGFMIFPLLASFGLLAGVIESETAGLGLIFGPMARTFAAMGEPTGNIIGAAFFLATFFAAFTSAISLSEPGIAYLSERFGVDRLRSAILVGGIIYLMGVMVSFDGELLNLEGGAITDAAVILGGFLIALYVGWFSPYAVAIDRMDESTGGVRLGRYVRPLMRWVMPVVLGVLFVLYIVGSPCWLTDGKSGVGVIESLFPSTKLWGCPG